MLEHIAAFHYFIGKVGIKPPTVTIECQNVSDAHRMWWAAREAFGREIPIVPTDPPYSGKVMGIPFRITAAKCPCCGRTV